jgi:hypothetical protein
MAGVACARWVPYDWFLSVLGYSLLITLVFGILATLDSTNERHAPMPAALILELLWLPSRNADIKLGLGLWLFFCAAGFVVSVMACAMFLPAFT